ncbi:MAG: membrane integrity-associated transporter subunit PqiC [Alphaproteobacteria bacterium]|nr:membrane integrity-associated transporter subunit PqiC [Alphaproteobacteria bacterium]
MKKSPYIAAALLVALAAACAITPRDTGSAFIFALPPAKVKTQTARRDKTLAVALPQVAAELDTYRIALKHGDRRWDYYAGARWSDFLPVVVRDDLTATLAASHVFKNVTTGSSGLDADLALKTNISAFQAEYADGGAPVIQIRMTAALVDRATGAQIAVFAAGAERKAAADTLDALQSAFAAAFGGAERRIALKLAALMKGR